MRILLIDTDTRSHEFLKQALGGEISELNQITDRAGVYDALIAETDYDVAVVNIDFDQSQGHIDVSRARRAGLDAPVVFVSECWTTEARIRAFGSGADDITNKWGEPDQLAARLRRLAPVRACEPAYAM